MLRNYKPVSKNIWLLILGVCVFYQPYALVSHCLYFYKSCEMFTGFNSMVSLP